MIKKGKASTRSTKTTKKSQPVEVVESQGSKSSYIYIAIIVVVIITAVVLMVMDKFKPMQEQQMIQKQQQNNAPLDDTEKLISRVSELIVVKKDEQPTVATVQNADLLKVDNPDFYKNAVNGDRLIIWSDKAVLYSTSEDKLLAVMPISQPEVDANATSTNATATTTEMTNETSTSTEMDLSAAIDEENPIIQVRNGTRIAGLAGKMSTFLKSHDLPIAVVSDAVGKSYTTTTIYRLTDEQNPATEKVLKKCIGCRYIVGLA